MCVVGLQIVNKGLVKQIRLLSNKDQFFFLQRLVILCTLSETGTFIARASALLFFGRIFNNAHTRFRYALLIAQGLNGACYLANILIIFFYCYPIRKYWIPDTPGTCLGMKTVVLAGDIPTLFIDFFVLFLPLPMLWRLHLPLEKKALVFGAFLCGYL